MLDKPPQDKLYKHLHVSNACEQSCIVMIMEGSKMSKTEYDFKAIIYPVDDTPHKIQFGIHTFKSMHFVYFISTHITTVDVTPKSSRFTGNRRIWIYVEIWNREMFSMTVLS